ncbi:hypothetical protein IAQ61_004551 [Plenodomus lingam]|uniref:uncharacterized protein n=1 Tax=Leptosphaeria maculans TaxID=5022 RepID=UPI003323633C|nr:hypothetical protein IAQ61_004551 [Plenodomus lingam]
MPESDRQIAVESNEVSGTQKIAVNENNNNENEHYNVINEPQHITTGNNGWSQLLHMHIATGSWKFDSSIVLVIIVIFIIAYFSVKSSSQEKRSNPEPSNETPLSANVEDSPSFSDCSSILKDILTPYTHPSSTLSFTPTFTVTSPVPSSTKARDTATSTLSQQANINPSTSTPTAFTTAYLLTAGSSCTTDSQCYGKICYTQAWSSTRFCCGPTIWGCPG